jgi:3',5'-cyclic AMP phosphodiesterase CpdA
MAPLPPRLKRRHSNPMVRLQARPLLRCPAIPLFQRGSNRLTPLLVGVSMLALLAGSSPAGALLPPAGPVAHAAGAPASPARALSTPVAAPSDPRGPGAIAAAPAGASLAAPAIAQAKTSVRLLAVADTGSGNSRQQAVADQMAAVHRSRPVDLVLLAGDNIYPDGDLKRVEKTFLTPYRALLSAGVPFHAALGNHDIRTGNGDPQVAYPPFGMKGRWYSLRRGPLEVFVIDTNTNARWQHQKPWLQKALAASTAPWKVVVGHHPIYSSGFYGDDSVAAARLGPLFRRYGVQLYINGHEHHYERSKPIDGTTYLIVGGGGASLRAVVPDEHSARAQSVHSFAEITATPTELKLVAWDEKGRKIDSAVLKP